MAHIDPAGGWLPLTQPQLDFWEEFSFHPDEPVSTVAHYIDLSGAVNESALLQAITRTVRESEVLSIRFRVGDDGETPQQCCDPNHAPVVELVDLRGNPAPLEEALRRMNADVEARLDLTADRLSAQLLYRIADNRYLWYIRAHHIVVDGYGLTLVEQRCGQLYGHYCGKGEAGPDFHPFGDFLAEEEAYKRSRRFEKDRDFWTAYLAAPADLPVLDKDCEDYGGGGLHADAALPPGFSKRLQRLAGALEIGWPDLLVLLSGLYLHGVLPRPDRDVLTLWLPFMSRWGSVGAHMPAMLVNILPFHLTIEPGEDVAAFLTRNAANLRKQRLHGRYRIEQIAADREIPKGRRFFFSPLVNVLPFSAPVFAGLTVARHILANGPGDGFNLTFRGEDDGSELNLHIDADSALTQAGDFARYRKELPLFLDAMLREEALALAAVEASTAFRLAV
ncbi:condensation protein [Agrobacterium pusense]|uniref:condensation domain-containing protein n=1 Tax=Agrobacterium pusense TaxID=648995 RepID=UPI0010BE44EB|nr:condensation domain-containing protein [Agrobacterium pusense]MBW9079271.1 condensation protein [Agrobacterium pusense]MDH0114306.1 condensation domain-containing protein [Agrobacterium pusense]QCL86082.1 condensation protein [Agrobacterium pusense]